MPEEQNPLLDPQNPSLPQIGQSASTITQNQPSQISRALKPKSAKVFQWFFLIFSFGINPLFLVNGIALLSGNKAWLKVAYWVNKIIILFVGVIYLIYPLFIFILNPDLDKTGGFGVALLIGIMLSPFLILLFITNLIIRKMLSRIDDFN